MTHSAKKVALALVILMTSGTLWAENFVQLVGQFGSSKAVLKINGQQRVVSVNETTTEGIQLISVDANQATIMDQGKKRVIGFNEQITTHYSEPTRRDVQIVANSNGSFTTNGSINGQVVKFLVDTGATTIAMNQQTAKRLGIDFRYSGKLMQATTASGVVPAYGIHLNSVAVGDIKQSNVKAVVLEGEYPQQVLLGMSFLDKLHLERKDNLMMLREKY